MSTKVIVIFFLCSVFLSCCNAQLIKKPLNWNRKLQNNNVKNIISEKIQSAPERATRVSSTENKNIESKANNSSDTKYNGTVSKGIVNSAKGIKDTSQMKKLAPNKMFLGTPVNLPGYQDFDVPLENIKQKNSTSPDIEVSNFKIESFSNYMDSNNVEEKNRQPKKMDSQEDILIKMNHTKKNSFWNKRLTNDLDQHDSKISELNNKNLRMDNDFGNERSYNELENLDLLLSNLNKEQENDIGNERLTNDIENLGVLLHELNKVPGINSNNVLLETLTEIAKEKLDAENRIVNFDDNIGSAHVHKYTRNLEGTTEVIIGQDEQIITNGILENKEYGNNGGSNNDTMRLKNRAETAFGKNNRNDFDYVETTDETFNISSLAKKTIAVDITPTEAYIGIGLFVLVILLLCCISLYRFGLFKLLN